MAAPLELTADAAISALTERADADDAQQLARYFQAVPGGYGEGDQFLGVRMTAITPLAKSLLGMPVAELERLLDSPWHEARMTAVTIMSEEARRARTDDDRVAELVDLSLRRHDRIDNWDLVDSGCRYLLGRFLEHRPRDLLDRLAASPSLWERRTAIVTTWYFIRRGESADVLRLAGALVDDREDLIHKAVGWMLRELGEVDRGALLGFLEEHAATMPRTMLRYAIEKLDPEERSRFLGMRARAAALQNDANA